MRIKINAGGFLQLDRGGSWKDQMCPFIHLDEGSTRDQCGDWCPHFREPQQEHKATKQASGLMICFKTFHYGEVFDEREKFCE